MYGNPTGAEAHMEGLCTMVNLRGGLESLGKDGVLRRWVIWYCHFIPSFEFLLTEDRSDLIASTRFETPPKFPRAPLPPAARIPLTSFLPPNYPILPLAPPPYFITPIERSGCLDLLAISNTMHELAFFLDATASLPGNGSDRILLEAGYHDRVSAIEYDLNVLLCEHPSHSSPKDDVGRVFILAALLHIYTCLRLTRSAVGIRISIAGRLQVALDALTNPPPRMWNEMLWICFLGLTTCSPGCKDWYEMRVWNLCEFLGLKSWGEVGVVLRKGVWIEGGSWRNCEDAWKAIQRKYKSSL
jgi:hypothetical protein